MNTVNISIEAGWPQEPEESPENRASDYISQVRGRKLEITDVGASNHLKTGLINQRLVSDARLLEERLMNFLTILVLALSSNLDNVGVGLAYGTRKLCLPFLSNLIIALITSCGTLLTMLLGKDLAALFLKGLLADYLGGGIIMIAGLVVLIQSFRQQSPAEQGSERHSGGGGVHLTWLKELWRLISDPELADRDYSGCIEASEAVVLGLALALNNLANGFAAGMLGLNPVLTTGAVFVFSLLTFWVGMLLGRRFISQIWGAWAGPAAGVMLILLGIYEMFQ